MTYFTPFIVKPGNVQIIVGDSTRRQGRHVYHFPVSIYLTLTTTHTTASLTFYHSPKPTKCPVPFLTHVVYVNPNPNQLRYYRNSPSNECHCHDRDSNAPQLTRTASDCRNGTRDQTFTGAATIVFQND